MKVLLRWIAVLPVAIICYLLGYALFKAFGLLSAYLGPHDDFDWVTNYTLPVLATGFAGYYYLKAGVYTAPKYRKTTAIILILFISLYLIIGTYSAIYLKHWVTLLEIIGTSIGLYIAYRELFERIEKI